MTRIFRQYFLNALTFLFFLQEMPPLNRKAFLREAFFVLLVRGGFIWLVSIFLHQYWQLIDKNECLALLSLFILFIIICSYCIPYFRVMHKRLTYLRFPYPRLFCTVVAMVMAYSISNDHAEPHWNDPISVIFFDYIPYLLLAPWKDQTPICQITACD